MTAVGHAFGSHSGTFCSICREVNHTADYCALRCVQQSGLKPSADGSYLVRKHATVASHSLCISWNRGQCLYFGSWEYSLVCFQHHPAIESV